MTKHIIFECKDLTEFQSLLDKTSSENNVFATQTHVTTVNGTIYYTAICFIRD